MSDNFKVGDVVVLKSGSDLMTITHINLDGASLAWFTSETGKGGTLAWTPEGFSIPFAALNLPPQK